MYLELGYAATLEASAVRVLAEVAAALDARAARRLVKKNRMGGWVGGYMYIYLQIYTHAQHTYIYNI